MKLAWLLFAAALLAPAVADARHVETKKVRYETASGMSKWYQVEVNFLTSSELNKATSSSKYGFTDEYAVIFWDDDEVTVIKLQGILFCYNEFTKSCLPTFSNLKGEDQQERKWEISAFNGIGL